MSNPGTVMFKESLELPLHLHKIELKMEGFFGVRAICKGCGWTLAGHGSSSDIVYWRARDHFEEVRLYQEGKRND